MTTKKHLKHLVRVRAAQTGEPYATALRKILQRKESSMSPDTIQHDVIAHCSFCSKPNIEVEKLVAGPGVYICNECIELSSAIIEETRRSTSEDSQSWRSQYYDRTSDDILGLLPALSRSAKRVEAELAAWIKLLRERDTDWEAIADAIDIPVSIVRQRFGAQPK